ncbi:hypothetical protein DWQ65_07195 [Treponema phagedenis]|uniref:DUF2846 domain-containing protein n=1 Tax=Treponema phagedenis TaxID=162 RepID=A0A0B7GV89_TREPH|nr:hypothetical protein [Treponema phagedenis]NVP25408.1 hypothetical protein [Treponema phagedenis]QEJ94900.1 hypothetical protein FUT79_06540 [Treponema phagedenis]QEJ97885.1 hypothetical protein FUT82_07675 [Treponema phagedenis]QEK00801.1 hypothetical protein FUT84_06200 [Treponema phagedenis]QEK03452.1 hypothetical protein FUT83_06290 [Treponema phagedenis]
MNKSLFFICSILFLGFFSSSAVTAQEAERAGGNEQSQETIPDLYYISAPILKVFPHKLGYYVIYRREGFKTGEVFIPHNWFKPEVNKARLVLVNTRVNPYLTFFIKEGAFYSVKIAAPQNLKSTFWGNLKAPALYNDKFNVETLPLEF